MSDLSTMMLMIRFYEFWRKDNLEPPEALRKAQIWLRDTTNIQKAEYFGSFLPEFGNSDNQSLPVHRPPADIGSKVENGSQKP